jgi:type I restriction enzyme S subunit
VVSGVVQQQVPEGYQRTEVGVIPEDWDIKPISEFADVSSGGTPNRKNKDYWNGNIPWVTTTLIDGKEINAAKQFITEKGIIGSATKWYSAGTLLMAMYGQGKTRGKVSTLGIDATINQACAGIAVKRLLDSQFLLHYLIGRYDDIRNLSNSGGQENLSGEIIKHIFVPVPKKVEQTAIANALSDVDALITSLEKLIAKKRAIKTATMQQLLTGKKRLPPFDQAHNGYKQTELGEIPEDWQCIDAKEAINFFGGFGFSSKLAASSGVRWLKIANVGLNEVKWDAESFLPERLKSDFEEYSLNAGDIVMALTRPILSDKLKVARIESADTPVLLNQRVAKLEPKSFHKIDFLYYVVQRLDFVAAMNLSMAGTDPPNIGTVALGKIKIISPGKGEEQNAIAIVLDDLDKEIEMLEHRLNKTQQLKQGMMQELLTGRTRLL